MKKVLALLLIAVMCCGVFAACSSPAAETPSDEKQCEYFFHGYSSIFFI